jgi:hypothetical protein
VCHQIAINGKAARGDGGGSHRAPVYDVTGCFHAGNVAQQGLEYGGQIVAEDGRLSGLPMGVGDDQVPAFPFRYRGEGFGQPNQALQQRVYPMLEAELEQSVVNIVAGARRMQPPGEVRPKAGAKLLLDEEEEVLDLAGIGQIAHVDLAVDGLESLGNRPRLLDGQDPGLVEHDEMRPVDEAEALDMMILGSVEQGTQHRLLVDRIREGGCVVEGACSHRLQPFNPASITPRTM